MSRPSVAGTRIPVYPLLQKRSAGETEAELLEAYPQLSKEDMRVAWEYAPRAANRVSLTSVADLAQFTRHAEMSTLAEIEEAAAKLSPEEKQELILFLAARLRADGAEMPAPRKYSREEMASWIARDEADMEEFRAGA